MQICWVIPDIHAAVKFLSNALCIAGFPQTEHVRAQDLNMTYYGNIVAGEWLTTQPDLIKTEGTRWVGEVRNFMSGFAQAGIH